MTDAKQDTPGTLAVDTFGMWIFLASEVMLFGGLFLGYTVCRWRYPAAFARFALAMDLPLGTLNTALLLTSSFTVALALSAAESAERWPAVRRLLLSALLGLMFEAIKGYEYYTHMRSGLWPQRPIGDGAGTPFALFVWFYYVATGLHAVHVAIGVFWLAGLAAALARRPQWRSTTVRRITLAGLYWHFVDIVWIFLYPLIYLGGHGS